MSLYERYELLDLDRDAGVKTFEAREIATGRPVKVHLFVHPSAPLQAALLKAIDTLPGDQLQRIVERGKHEGTPYVVTDRLADYAGLNEWLQAVEHSAKPVKPLLETAGAWKVPAPSAAAPSVAASSAPAPVSTPVAPPNAHPITPPNPHLELNQKFTELFATAERPILADSLLQPPRRSAPNIAAPLRPPDPQPPAAPAAQVKPEPGEFTRMFQSPVAAPATDGPALQPLSKSPAPAATEPGEFTRMFQAPAGHGTIPTAAPTAAVPPPAATKSGPGDFTRFFESASAAGPVPQSPAVQQPLAPQAPGRSGFNQVSEFTRTFGKPGNEPPAPTPAAAPQQEPGEFTRMFHSPAGGGKASGSAALPVAPPLSPMPQPAAQPLLPATASATPGFSIPAPVPVAPQPSGPGEYTRQFSAPAQLTFGQTSPTSPAPAASRSPQAFAPPAIAQSAMPNMAPAPAPARKSNLPLILGIVGIVILAALLIVFFAMRPK